MVACNDDNNNSDTKRGVFQQPTSFLYPLPLNSLTHTHTRSNTTEHHQEMRNLAEQFAAELKAANGQRSLVEEEKADMEQNLADLIASAEAKHNYDMSKMESDFQHKVMQILDRYKEASEDLRTAKEDWAARHRGAENEHKAEVHKLNTLHSLAMSAAKQRIFEERRNVEALKKKLGERLAQGAEEAEGELESLKASYRARIGAQREAGQQYKIENGIMRKKHVEMMETLDHLRSEKIVKETRCADLRRTVESFEVEISSLKALSLKKDSLMVEKEKRVGAFACYTHTTHRLIAYLFENDTYSLAIPFPPPHTTHTHNCF